VTLLMALIAALNAVARPAATRPREVGTAGAAVRVGLAAAAGVGVVTIACCAASVADEAFHLEAARHALAQGQQGTARSEYEEALGDDGWDGTAAGELLDAFTGSAAGTDGADPSDARRWIERLRQCGFLSEAARHEARLYYELYLRDRQPASLEKAVDAIKLGVALYPTSPERRLALGRMLTELAARVASEQKTDEAAAMRRDAAVELKAALDLDARRIHVSQPNRFDAATRETIAKEIAALQ